MSRPRRHRSTESGFTLVEVMVAVLIFGLLIGVVIPSFVEARVRGQNRAAQASLRTAETTARALFLDGSSFDLSVGELELAEPSLAWTTGASTGPREVAISGTVDQFAAAVLSDSGECFFLLLSADGPTTDVQNADASCGALSANLSNSSVDATITGDFAFDVDGFVGTTNTFACCGGNDVGEITYTFTVTTAGRYKMLGTVKAFQGNTDSFWVQTSLDGFSSRYLWDVRHGNPTTDFVNNRGSGDVELEIPAGTVLTVKVSVREDGTFIGGLELVPV